MWHVSGSCSRRCERSDAPWYVLLISSRSALSSSGFRANDEGSAGMIISNGRLRRLSAPALDSLSACALSPARVAFLRFSSIESIKRLLKNSRCACMNRVCFKWSVRDIRGRGDRTWTKGTPAHNVLILAPLLLAIPQRIDVGNLKLTHPIGLCNQCLHLLFMRLERLDECRVRA